MLIPELPSTDALMTLREALRTQPDSGLDAMARCALLTHTTEAWFVACVRAALPEHIRHQLLVHALGSFGRQELCLHSDLDVLIEVHDARILDDPDFLPGITQIMDIARAHRIRLKHAIRTPVQHRHELTQDWRTPVAMLDARIIHDPGVLATESSAHRDALTHLRAEDEGRSFIDRLIEAHLTRRDRQNQSVYLLEPDIKSGLGALRDLNTLHWASLVRFGHPPETLDRPEWRAHHREMFMEIRAWLLDLRMHLHTLNTRAQDRLRFSEQEAIAHRLFADHHHPIEALMQEHYTTTRMCLQQLDRALRQWGSAHWLTTTMNHIEELPNVPEPQRALSPALCFDVLHHASAHQLTLGPALEQQITEEIKRWPDDARDDPAAQARFVACLTTLEIAPVTSSRMLDLGLLTFFLPEFIPLVCHVQHDTYHVYTTDVHTLKCMERARALLHDPSHDEACERWPAFVELGLTITRHDILLLAALLHDIGKNRGGDHSNRGADLVPAIAARWGLDAADTTLIELLVRQHLLLSNTSRRRDITDEKVLSDVLEIINDRDTLTLLTCLTFCDMSTVSTTSMNDWRANLLLQLHRQLIDRLAHDARLRADGEAEDRSSTRALRYQEHVGLAHQEDHDIFVQDITEDRLPHIDLHTYGVLFETYQHHLHHPSSTSVIFRDIEDFAPAQKSSYIKVTHQVVIATRDIPGALAKIAGVLSSQGLNILSAEIISTRSGKVLDLFHVEIVRHTPQENAPPPIFTQARKSRIIAELQEVLDSGKDVRTLLDMRRAHHIALRDSPEVHVKVDAYQDVSDDYTVIEVHAPDRRGLLYDLAGAMHAHKVEIRRSKLDLLGNQAVDTFYVERTFGGKLEAQEIARLTQALHDVANAPSSEWVHDEPD